MKLAFAMSMVSLLLVACVPTTEFRGRSTTPQGPATCQAQCSAWGMELVGMVSMGENYTDGCICGVPGRDVSAIDAAPAAIAGSVGVETQRREEEQRRQQQQQQMGPR